MKEQGKTRYEISQKGETYVQSSIKLSTDGKSYKGFTLWKNREPPEELLESESASKIVAWSVPCSEICAMFYLLI